MPEKVVGYYGSWSVYRPGNGKFTIDNIDPHKFTHLIYAFIGLNEDATIKIIDKWNDVDCGGLKNFVALRNKNAALKVMVAIGGWNEPSSVYSRIAEDSNLRERFAMNMVNFLKEYQFDGLDFDWEYPAQRGGKPADKRYFVELLKVLKNKFRGNYLLSAAVGASNSTITTSYDVSGMSQYLDFINLMEYDLHGSWDNCTGNNAPLNPLSATDVLNIRSSVASWINAGAPAHKLVLGVPTYGHTFSLGNSNNNKVGAKTNGPGEQGPYTKQAGMLGFNEICEVQNHGGWNIVWDDIQKVPYMYKNNQWVSFDNVRSIIEKVQYTRSQHLGVMVWSIETDDFLGISGQRYPLMKLYNVSQT